MNRVFNDEQTPAAILQLRPRAYSGVIWWGACMLLWNGAIIRGIFEILRSLYIYPSIEQTPRLHYYFSHIERYSRTHRRMWAVIGRVVEKGLFWLEWGCSLMGIRRQGRYGPWNYEI
jgi:hypothetical protein